MPFKSEAQRRWMWKNNPAMARRWAEHTPQGKKLPKKVTANVRTTKLDPSRTSMLRKRFEREVIKRYTAVKRAIYQLIVVEDALGLKDQPKHTNNWLLNFVLNTRWKFRTSPQKLEEFRRWLQEQINLEIIPDEDDPIRQDEWWEKYVYESYEKGVLRSYNDAAAKKLGEPDAVFDARKDQFLRDSFVQPESAEKVKLLAGRVFTDLKGVTDVMSQQMSQVLVEGLSAGDNPLEIARELNAKLDIGINRSRTIARTEVIRAHAEGQLDALERMGVEEVGVAVEWDTAGDGRVCPLCSSLDGVVLKVKESHGMIPRHPNCRCSFLPANVGEPTKGQIRTKQGIQEAINESIEREIPQGSKRTLAEQKKRTKWGGADTKINKNRPKSIV